MKKFEKSLKILWFVNGVILLLIMSVLSYQLIDELLPQKYYYDNNDLIVGDKLDEAREQGLKLQGLSYSAPKHMSHSDLLFMTVSTNTYEQPIIDNLLGEYAMELHPGYVEGSYDDLNIIFLNQNYEVIGTLLDKKANIAETKFEKPDTSISSRINDQKRHLVSKIAFKDSNSDGFINSTDSHDLYISSLIGKNLTQITNNLDVQDFKFLRDQGHLFITYYERDDKRLEHKRKKFAIYDFASESLKLAAGLNKTIDDLENLLTE